MPRMEGEMPGENHCRGLTYKSHAVTAAHTHTHPETFTGSHTHINPKADTGRRQPHSQACLTHQIGQTRHGSFTWKHVVSKELPIPCTPI